MVVQKTTETAEPLRRRFIIALAILTDTFVSVTVHDDGMAVGRVQIPVVLR